ncbi:MAG: hypothetical protein ACYC3L_12245 [Gemmatimonadaceae bacterium]
MRFTLVLIAMTATAAAVGAQASGAVLVLPASARAAGAGDAASLATGASALFYGAQHLPGGRAVSASAGTWIGGAQLSSFAGSMPLGRATVVGLGVQSLDYGSADEIVPDPLTGGRTGTATGDRIGANEVAATLGLARTVGVFRLGMAFSYVHQQVADASASTAMLSVGEGITLRGWDVDWSMEHVRFPFTRAAGAGWSLPSTYRGGLATPALELGGARWRGIAEYRTIRDAGSTTLLGAEGAFATRAGWTLEARGAALAYSDESVRAPWSAGGSAARGAWSLDYAYQGFGALGAVHRMGVTWHSRVPQSPSR